MTQALQAQLDALSDEQKRAAIVYLESTLADNDGDDLSPEIKAELDRRWAAYLANPNSAIPWEEFKARARTRLEQRSARA